MIEAEKAAETFAPDDLAVPILNIFGRDQAAGQADRPEHPAPLRSSCSTNGLQNGHTGGGRSQP